MTTPIDPTLVRMQETMAAAHRLALDAVLLAKTVGMREGINAAANIIDTATKTLDLPDVFVQHLQWISDQIRLLAYQLSDPESIGTQQ